MDSSRHNVLIELCSPIIEMRQVDLKQEEEILRVINLFNSTIQEMTGIAPVTRIAID